jgi:hypothetical protein
LRANALAAGEWKPRDSDHEELDLFGSRAWLAGLLVLGFLARCLPAWHNFLNPDEAWHFLLSQRDSLPATYRISLTTAHPPLYLLFLHVWTYLGRSEVWLRMPSILAGTAACWITYLWMRMVSRRAALIGLALLLFLPTTISLSAEVRQYAVLLCFCSGTLYEFDMALARSSVLRMALSAMALWFALLTHYSALLFAPAFALYALLRLLSSAPKLKITVTWIAGQLAATAFVAFLFFTHIRKLRSSGLTQQIADTWLRASLFHSQGEHAWRFLASNTVRLFRFTFSHGTIGVIGFVVFAYAIFTLARGQQPKHKQIAFLLLLPFLLTMLAGLLSVYPYGGTRHDFLLAWLVVIGISFGLAFLRLDRRILFPAVAVGLIVCHVFSSPTPPFITFKNQDRNLMREAVQTIRQQAAPGTTLLTDYEGGLLLSYYLCDGTAVDLSALDHGFDIHSCGPYRLLAPHQDLFVFDLSDYRDALTQVSQFSPSSKEWFFEAGWIDSGPNGLRSRLAEFGCGEPRFFGKNIYLCEVRPPR